MERTKAHLTYANTHNLTVTALAFAWCWDMTWTNSSDGGVDPLYQVRWANFFRWRVGWRHALGAGRL